MTLGTAHDELLNAIEDAELLSLKWGDVNASLSQEDLEVIAAGLFNDGSEGAIEALIEARLVCPFESPGAGERYRSRFAEMVRLLARSRQIFAGEDWRGSPPLVADFRVDLRKRRYPLRDQERDHGLVGMGNLTKLQGEVWRAIAPTMLSGFQLRAVRRLLTPSETDTGTIVTAGTGSGKTLAFYLPAFMRIAGDISPGVFWVKALAIYPRKELLKDQLTEAYRNAGRCAGLLGAARGRSPRIGTFYGDTPKDASPASLASSWPQRDRGWVCPFLRCGCDAEMLWLTADVAARRERLTCSVCGEVSDEERLILTRFEALRRPPDILFTTTEMLNLSMSDQRRRALFGLGRRREERPGLILLDEAHTYTGTSGAHAALTLRRWRALAGGPISWVGLSATLGQAQQFFSELTGVEGWRVAEVTPFDAEMIEEGREYQVVLRGDPASRASLLSTSIQAAMLIGRTLDPARGRSQGRVGQRLFAFTDDLDVTHRLFDNLRDAEAYDRFGRPDPARQPLSVLRARNPSESDTERRRRDADGQRWRMPEEVGRPLGTRLRVGKTTSRDPGVDGGADVIVATSALEVGFNDPTVGAVLQHKAPRDFSSFVQRRGRAGRDRRMRPLTVTVLSDYGRDRSLFQAFEHLFDPTLSPQSLPIRNQYVLRMQAAFALLDWIGEQSRPEGVRAGSVWNAAAFPFDAKYGDPAWTRHVQTTIGRVVKGEPQAIGSLQAHLCTALGIESATVDRLLWEPPRSLLLEVAPTLARRLLRNWALAWPVPGRTEDLWIPNHPLPDAVPRTLFSDLNLPEVELRLPPAMRGHEETSESLPIQQALSQLAPGRVTRRFGDAYGGLAHWVPVPPGVQAWNLPVRQYAEVLEYVGQFSGESPAGWVARPVYRPWRVALQKAAGAEVTATSNSMMIWASGFESNGEPVEIAPPARTPWRGLVSGVRLYLQPFRASVTVRRFALGARAEIRRPGGVEQLTDIGFTEDDGSPAALGYEFETDALSLSLSLPSVAALIDRRFEPAVERGLRAAYLRRLVQECAVLPREINNFQRAWLRQVHLLVAARRALGRGETLSQAAAITDSHGMQEYEEVMDSLLGVQRDGLPDDENSDAATRPDRLERLRESLLVRLRDGAVRSALNTCLTEAFEPASRGRAEFIRRTVEATLAEALISAAEDSAPRHAAADALIVDVVPDPTNPDGVTLWLTETVVGGAGVLQALAEAFAREPRSLFRAVEAALEPSDIELASGGLARAFRLSADGGEVSAAIQAVRNELGHAGRNAARQRLLGLLDSRGVETGRALVVSLNARMLAPGLRPEHDAAVRELLELWDRAEAQLGIELEPRELAVLAADTPSVLQAAVAAGLFPTSATIGERVTVIGALLWPRASVLRRENLSSFNPFRARSGADPAMVRALLLDADEPSIQLDQASWPDDVVLRLAELGTARVETDIARTDLLRSALVRLPAMPVVVGHLRLYPVLERVCRDELHLYATFVLREQL